MLPPFPPRYWHTLTDRELREYIARLRRWDTFDGPFTDSRTRSWSYWYRVAAIAEQARRGEQLRLEL